MSSSPTGAPSHELARFLVDELRGALPSDVEIEAADSDVIVRFRGLESSNGTAAILDEDDGRSFVERVETAALAVISHVQDAAADATGEPWPASGADMPLPHVEVADGDLRAWFGQREAAALALEPLAISALRQR